MMRYLQLQTHIWKFTGVHVHKYHDLKIKIWFLRLAASLAKDIICTLEGIFMMEFMTGRGPLELPSAGGSFTMSQESLQKEPSVHIVQPERHLSSKKLKIVVFGGKREKRGGANKGDEPESDKNFLLFQ